MIGVAIAGDRLRALEFVHGEILWFADAEYQRGMPLLDALGALISSAPTPKSISRVFRRSRVAVAIGPSIAHLKLLRGLPAMDPSLGKRVVQESVFKFFPRDDGALVITGVAGLNASSLWAAAIPRALVAEIQRACATLKLTCSAIVPTLAVLPLSSPDDVLDWRDSGVRVRLTCLNGQLQAIERSPQSEQLLEADGEADNAIRSGAPSVVQPLGTIGEDAWQFADAFGAARVDRRHRLALTSNTRDRERPTVPIWRAAVAGAGMFGALAFATISPGLSARRQRMADMAALERIAIPAHQALLREDELRWVSATLREVESFEGRRTRATRLLASVAQSLPDSTAIASVHFDSSGGILVAVTPRAASMVDALEHIHWIASPDIEGPIVREAFGKQELERVAIRFRFVPLANSSSVGR